MHTSGGTAQGRSRCVLHRLHEVVASHGHAVVAVEVEIHAARGSARAEQRVLHADDLGPFLVDRAGVEVVDLEVLAGRTCAPSVPRPPEIARGAGTRRGDALDGARVRSLVNSWSRKTVRPSFSESWNQSRQVTRLPVQLWKYSWPMTRFDRLVVVVGRGRGVGEDEPAVEDVQDLVLHRPHVEVVGAEDHEASRSYSRPKRSSSQRNAFFTAAIACRQRGMLAASNRSRSVTCGPIA